MLHKTVFILLLKLIARYSENTLTGKCAYLPDYQHLCWPCKPKLFLRNLRDSGKILQFVPRDILLPPGFALSFPGQTAGRRADIRLENRYGRLDFRFPAYWARITEESSRRTYKTATRFMDATGNITLVSLGLRLTLQLKPPAMLAGEDAERSCGWLAGLMIDARRWLSWEHYQQNDLERMVVDLHQHFIQQRNNSH